MFEARSSNEVVLTALDEQIAALERELENDQSLPEELDDLRRARAALIRASRAAFRAAACA
jgi:hypothetical protein